MPLHPRRPDGAAVLLSAHLYVCRTVRTPWRGGLHGIGALWFVDARTVSAEVAVHGPGGNQELINPRRRALGLGEPGGRRAARRCGRRVPAPAMPWPQAL